MVQSKAGETRGGNAQLGTAWQHPTLLLHNRVSRFLRFNSPAWGEYATLLSHKYTIYEKVLWWRGGTNKESRDSERLYMFSALLTKKIKVFRLLYVPVSTYVYIYLLMYSLLPPEWLDEFHSHLVLNSLFIIGWCLVNMNILPSNIGAFQMGHKKQKSYFLETNSNHFV
jgi:hypothetical protein